MLNGCDKTVKQIMSWAWTEQTWATLSAEVYDVAVQTKCPINFSLSFMDEEDHIGENVSCTLNGSDLMHKTEGIS